MQKTGLHIIAFFLLFLTGNIFNAHSAPIFNAPAIRIQPNGDTLKCFLSGDEFYHRLHDAKGYTIIQNKTTGYWVYADTVHIDGERNGEQPVRPTTGREQRWELVATDYVAGKVDPATVGISPNLGVDKETWRQLQHRYDVPKQYSESTPKTSGTNHGTMNNIVIFVRFNDDPEISTSFQTINAMFNDSTATSTSMYNYFKHASYNKIFIPTHYFPAPNGNTIISYQDSLSRGYYLPYNATTAPLGYTDDDERREREFGLLERAVNYINANYPIPSSINLDMDNDGKVDNICFVVKGTYTGWSDLLWPHKWSLYDRQVYINNKRVYTFNFQLEGSGSHYFSSSTFCHEMFHTLGAPDLYRYDVHDDVSGVGSWDLMCSNTTPPQHMSAYMKWKYGNWIDSIPQITIPGTYTLHSLADSDYSNCAYKIATPDPHQWYVLEYRDNTELFEVGLSGKGLLIFRIDDRYHGNASYNGVDEFDEVWLFRPNANNDTTNGNLAQAFFSGNTNRTSFSPNTNPYPWLTGNVIDTTIAITDVTSPGETISFTYLDLQGCRTPYSMTATSITGTSVHLSWEGNAPSYWLQWRKSDNTGLENQLVNATSYTVSNLALNTEYEWRVKGMCSNADSSEWSTWKSFITSSCLTPLSLEVGAADTLAYTLPVNNYYNYTYSQMIYTPEEIGQEMIIQKLAFKLGTNNHMTRKTECAVYLGHTSLSSFTSNSYSNMIPVSQLTKVYQGAFDFTNGWNELELDSNFAYDGTSNLVIAVDDNSHAYDGTSYRFVCDLTPERYSSLSSYSDSYNPDPYSSTSSANCARRRFHPQIKLIGCPSPQYYNVTTESQPSSMGQTSGDGQYLEGTTATITATPIDHHHFVNWQFDNGDIVTENPYSFAVTRDIVATANFAINKYLVKVTCDTSEYGEAFFLVNGSTNQLTEDSIDYGTGIRFTATANPQHGDTVYNFLGWSNGVSEMAFDAVVESDLFYTALFSRTITTHESIGLTEEDGVTVYSKDGKLFIIGAEGRQVEVCDILGRCIASSCFYSGHTQGLSLRSGIYIVRIQGLEPKKIVVR